MNTDFKDGCGPGLSADEYLHNDVAVKKKK